MSLEEYLGLAVFTQPRTFTLAEFRAYMLSLSVPFPESIALARALAASGRYRLMTINNESAELNSYRLATFGLHDIFTSFYSSCWIGATKPMHRIYELALAMSQADPEIAVHRRSGDEPGAGSAVGDAHDPLHHCGAVAG